MKQKNIRKKIQITIWVLLFLCFYYTKLRSQNNSISVENYHLDNYEIFHGIENKIKVMVENAPCDSFTLLGSCFQIIKHNNCIYDVKPNIECDASVLYIKDISSGNIIDSIIFSILDVPIDYIEIGGFICNPRFGKTYKIGKLFVQSDYERTYLYSVSKFKYVLSFNDKVISSGFVTGDHLPKHIIKKISKSKRHLKVVLSEITLLGPDGHNVFMEGSVKTIMCK